MSANVIIFDGMYTANKIRSMNSARELVEAAVQDIKRASDNNGWKCPEARKLDRHLNNVHSKLSRLGQGIGRVELALGDGLKGFHELEERAARQAEGLADNLKERNGFEASRREDDENTIVASTLIPGLGVLQGTIGSRIARMQGFLKSLFERVAEQRRQAQAKKLENFFYENFPWLEKNDTPEVTPAPTPTPTPQPATEPQPESVSEPVTPPRSGGWDASGGWDSVGDSFPNKRPDLSSVYYSGENPEGRQLAYGKEGRHGTDSIDCCFYARARAMEVNGWTKTYGTYTKDYSADAIKAGNRVVRFDTGRGSEMHFVFVEHYDEATDTVYFSDSNMGGSPATDGSLKSRSFSEFLNYFPNGRYVYTENP